ncbi:MAG: hypothetical protein HW380_3983 [Magnetococcales bacterium]|nr:hypothetical protein [Magnetococcales bacterium]
MRFTKPQPYWDMQFQIIVGPGGSPFWWGPGAKPLVGIGAKPRTNNFASQDGRGLGKNMQKVKFIVSMAIRLAKNVVIVCIVYAIIFPILLLMRPFKKIIIANYQSSRIGGCHTLNYLLIRKMLHDTDPGTLHILASEKRICNYRYHNFVKRYFLVLHWRFRVIFLAGCSSDFGRKIGFVPEIPYWYLYRQVYRAKNECPFSFSVDEEVEGKEKLRQMGITEDMKRDVSTDWSYHDFRDCKIENYFSAARHIMERGGKTVRVGVVVDDPLGSGAPAGLVDYPSLFRDEFMDLYLMAKNRFFLGNTSGPFAVSVMFNCPVALANWIPPNHLPLGPKSLYIPKLIWDNNKNRYLSFQEMHDLGLFTEVMAGYGGYYKERGIIPIENSGEDIFLLCREMIENLEGEVRPGHYHESQIQFKRRFQSHIEDGEHAGNISAYFLEKYQSLM